MPLSQKPSLLLTGSSRGIGKALRDQLSDRYNFIELVRTPQKSTENNLQLQWDLGRDADAKTLVTLTEHLATYGLGGILHCAGVLGPWGGPETLAASPHYWDEHMAAYRINTRAPFDLLGMALPYLKPTPYTPPFILHLSSGAALKPYVGWETYCMTKAACLMAFKALAKRYKPEELLCLSVAPGTVMTDMMTAVLAANKNTFPDADRFHQLKDEGKLVSPTLPAVAIDRLLHGPKENLFACHGEFYDVRSTY